MLHLPASDVFWSQGRCFSPRGRTLFTLWQSNLAIGNPMKNGSFSRKTLVSMVDFPLPSLREGRHSEPHHFQLRNTTRNRHVHTFPMGTIGKHTTFWGHVDFSFLVSPKLSGCYSHLRRQRSKASRPSRSRLLYAEPWFRHRRGRAWDLWTFIRWKRTFCVIT